MESEDNCKKKSQYRWLHKSVTLIMKKEGCRAFEHDCYTELKNENNNWWVKNYFTIY